MKPSLGSLLLSVVLLAPTVSSQDGKDFMPLQHGNLWVYTTNFAPVMTWSVEQLEQVNGVPCARVSTVIGGNQVKDEWFAADAKGLRLVKMKTVQGEMVFEEALMRLRLPIKNGDRWTTRSKDPQGNLVKASYEVESPAKVKAGGKEYEAVKVSTLIEAAVGTQTRIAWYVAGIGVVKETYSSEGQEDMVAELKDFRSPTAGKRAALPPQDGKSGGAKLTCKCGGAIAEGKKFCGECGTPAPKPEEKKPDAGKCAKCGNGLPKDAKFCGECGNPAPKPEEKAPTHCGKCGKELAKGAKFCGECGSPVPGSGTGRGDGEGERNPADRP